MRDFCIFRNFSALRKIVRKPNFDFRFCFFAISGRIFSVIVKCLEAYFSWPWPFVTLTFTWSKVIDLGFLLIPWYLKSNFYFRLYSCPIKAEFTLYASLARDLINLEGSFFRILLALFATFPTIYITSF